MNPIASTTKNNSPLAGDGILRPIEHLHTGTGIGTRHRNSNPQQKGERSFAPNLDLQILSKTFSCKEHVYACQLSFTAILDEGNVPKTASQSEEVMPKPLSWILKWWLR